MNQIDVYIQKIRSSLQQGSALHISTFIDEHIAMQPLLHPLANKKKVDISALIYSLLRLPEEILSTQTVLLGQSDRVFSVAGHQLDSADWQSTKAVARNRDCAYNATTKQLAAFIASVTDVQDIVTVLTALYIEITKLHQATANDEPIERCFIKADYIKLREVLGNRFTDFEAIVKEPIDWSVQLLAGSNVDYAHAVQQWWVNIASSRKQYPWNVYTQPVYFVSSNSHSLMNVLSGYALKQKKALLKDNAAMLNEQQAAFESEDVPEENLLYYLSRFTAKRSAKFRASQAAFEKRHGLIRVKPFHHIDIESQIFSLKDLVKNPALDPRIRLTATQKKRLEHSDALIINIAYPLGMAAYRILQEVSENVPELRGVYIMGKAASINSAVGDITIPHAVYDNHFRNMIFLHNDFSAETFKSYIHNQSILDAQQSLCVNGTFLQNETSLTEAFQKDFSIIEMEAGPYLNRVYEMIHPTRHPQDATFVLNPDFRLGMAYYVSDTPQKQGVNLGAKRLTWEGLNATYAISLGIIQDIVDTETSRFA